MSISEAMIAMTILVIFVVAFLVFTGKSGTLDPISDWFDSFSNPEKKICTENNGEWCKEFSTCPKGREINKPDTSEPGKNWKCCNPGECVSIHDLDWVTEEKKEWFDDINVEFRLDKGYPGTVLYSTEKNIKEHQDVPEMVYGETNKYEVYLVIFHEKGIKFEYQLATRETNKIGDGVLSSGIPNDPAKGVVVRGKLVLGKDDKMLQLRVWSIDEPNKEFLVRVSLAGKLKLPSGNSDGIIMPNEGTNNKDFAESLKVLRNSGNKLPIYVFGTGPELWVHDYDVIPDTGAQKGETYDIGLNNGDKECQEKCDKIEGCIFGIAEINSNNCFNCMGDKKQIENQCLTFCNGLGTCKSITIAANIINSNTQCNIRCTPKYIRQNDFKLYDMGSEGFVDVYVWDKSKKDWRKLDCSILYDYLSHDDIKETFSETVWHACMDMNKEDFDYQ